MNAARTATAALAAGQPGSLTRFVARFRQLVSCKELRSIRAQLTYVVSEDRIDRNDAAGRELTKPQQKLARDPG